MITEQQYQQLKQEHENAKAEAEQAKGALAQLTQQLKEEFGCTDLKQAERKLDELTDKQAKAEKDFQRAWNDYQSKWSND